MKPSWPNATLAGRFSSPSPARRGCWLTAIGPAMSSNHSVLRETPRLAYRSTSYSKVPGDSCTPEFATGVDAGEALGHTMSRSDPLLMLADIAQLVAERPETDEQLVRGIYQYLVMAEG